jgi:hypothetical protein
MESAKKQVRAIWPLLKARVAKRTETEVVLTFGAEYGSPTRITIAHDMRGYDVREGDLLTLYTEVLLKPTQGEA